MPPSRDGSQHEDSFGSEEPIDPRRLMSMLRQQRLLIAVTTSLAVAAVLAWTYLPPDVYEARCRVANEGTPEVMEVGPGFMPAERSVTATPVAAISDEVLARVVDRVVEAPAVAAAPPPPDWLAWFRGSPVELSAAQHRHRRVEGLRRRMTLDFESGGAVLVVSAMSTDAVGAAALANAVGREFVSYRNEQRQAAFDRASVWLTRRALELRAAIEQRESALAELVVREGLDRPRQDPTQGQLRARLEADLQSAELERLEVAQRLADLGPLVDSIELTQSSKEIALQRQIYLDAKAKLEVARLLFTSTHPEVIRLEARVADFESKLSGEGLLDAQLDQGRREKALADLQELERQHRGLETRVAVLREALRAAPRARRTPDPVPSDAYRRVEQELAVDRDTMELLLRRRNELNLSAETDLQTTRILDAAVAPVDPIGPNRRARLAVGGLVAIGMGLGLGLLRESLDPRIRDAVQVGALLGLPQLGSIPRVRMEPPRRSKRSDHEQALFADAVETLRAELMLAMGRGPEPTSERKIGTLLITSGVPGEGKTTISCHLAAAFAAAGHRTLLIDADMRRPRVHKLLEVDPAPGLSEVLRSQDSIESVITRPDGCEFEVVTCGTPDTLPSLRLGAARLEGLFALTSATHDLVIVDSPVLLSVADSMLLAAQADAVLLVYKPNSLDRSGLTHVRESLEHADARVLGFVMSQVNQRDPYQYPAYLSSPYT